MASDWTLCSGPMQGIRKEKSRFTDLTCCNTDGSEKLSLMFIGIYWRQRAFGKKSGQEHGLDYQTIKRDWMTVDLFFMVETF